MLNNAVYVSFSGGKDSTVLSDITAKVCKMLGIPLRLVFVNTGLEFPEVRLFVKEFKKWLEDKYQIEVILDILKPEMRFDKVIKEYGWNYPSKDVAECIWYARRGSRWAINKLDGNNSDGTYSEFKQRYKRWKFLLDSPFIISKKCCDIMKEDPLRKYEKETGYSPIVASMASESQRRKDSWLKTGCNAFDSEIPMSKPMSFWTEKDVLTYLKINQIPYASVYGDIVEEKGKLKTIGEERTGCMFCPTGCHLDKVNKFQRMKITHPKQYEYCMKDEADGGLGLSKFLDYIGVEY